jgi:hypothetical protein
LEEDNGDVREILTDCAITTLSQEPYLPFLSSKAIAGISSKAVKDMTSPMREGLLFSCKGRRIVGLEVFLGKRPAGGGFEVVFEITGLLTVFKSNGRLDLPGPKFGRVVILAGVVGL